MRFLYLPFILLLATSIVSADCEGYIDSFNVLVVDAKLRPVEGAAVQVKYDPGTSFGEKYYATPARYTDSSGKLSYIVRNQGTSTRSSDCTITINATKSGVKKTESVEANRHSNNIVIKLPIHRVFMRVRDQYGQAIENASISIRTEIKQTDEYGQAIYSLKDGEYEYFVSYKGGKQSELIEIDDDLIKEVILEHHPLKISIVDDQGTLVKSNITINNETIEVLDGKVEYDEVYGDEVDYLVEYEGIEKQGTIDLTLRKEKKIVFDLHAPDFGAVSTTGDPSLTRLMIPVTDEGEYASGLDFKSIQVSYRLEPTDATTPWNDAIVFASSVDTFMADFPDLPKNSIVQFRIEIKDNEGNKATLEGRFSPPETPDPQENQTVPNGGNGGQPHENGGNEQEIPLIYIISGVIITVLIIIIVLRMKSKQNNSVEEQ